MLIDKFQKHIESLADASIAEHSKKFFKTGKGEYAEGDIFLGIRVPVLRKLIKQYRDLSLDAIIEILHSPYHEVRLFALLLLVDLFKKEKYQNQIYQLYLENTKYINNWDLVDSSAEHIIGAYIFQKDTSILFNLVHSCSLWERRISIIATFYFIKQNSFETTIKLAELLLIDKEDLIHKAVGWMLREVAKRDKAIIVNFLQQYYKIMPRTMLRYSIEKFNLEERQAYLKSYK